MTHVVRLRCADCGKRCGWVDRDAGRLVLVAAHHVAAPSYRTRESRRFVDDLPADGGPLIWDCPAVRCGHEVRLSAERCRELAAAASPPNVRDVRV